jgi:hypothetical protein
VSMSTVEPQLNLLKQFAIAGHLCYFVLSVLLIILMTISSEKIPTSRIAWSLVIFFSPIAYC